MSYRCNGKQYMSLDQAKRAAEKIHTQTGAVVAIEATGTSRAKRCPNCLSRIKPDNQWLNDVGRCEWCAGKGDYYD